MRTNWIASPAIAGSSACLPSERRWATSIATPLAIARSVISGRRSPCAGLLAAGLEQLGDVGDHPLVALEAGAATGQGVVGQQLRRGGLGRDPVEGRPDAAGHLLGPLAAAAQADSILTCRAAKAESKANAKSSGCRALPPIPAPAAVGARMVNTNVC